MKNKLLDHAVLTSRFLIPNLKPNRNLWPLDFKFFKTLAQYFRVTG